MVPNTTLYFLAVYSFRSVFVRFDFCCRLRIFLFVFDSVFHPLICPPCRWSSNKGTHTHTAERDTHVEIMWIKYKSLAMYLAAQKPKRHTDAWIMTSTIEQFFFVGMHFICHTHTHSCSSRYRQNISRSGCTQERTKIRRWNWMRWKCI